MTHSVVLDCAGRLYAFGTGRQGQLGLTGALERGCGRENPEEVWVHDSMGSFTQVGSTNIHRWKAMGQEN